MRKAICKATKEECPHFYENGNLLFNNECPMKCIGAEMIETSDKSTEAIKHPAHYNFSKYEPVKVIREWGLNFNLGNVVKYVARAGRKDDIVQDLKKARQYLDFEIEALEGGATE